MSERQWVHSSLAAAMVVLGCTEVGVYDGGVLRDGSRHFDAASDSEPVDAGLLDAASQDAGTLSDAELDGGPADAGLLGAVDGGTCGCIDSTLSWRYAGGLVVRRCDSEIRRCRDYTYTRTIGTGPTVMCEDEVLCSGDQQTIGDVARALADGQVQAALTGTPVVYGRDTRPVGGQVFVIEYRGREITVGSPCAGTSGCVPIPDGIQRLKDLLELLEEERLRSEPCVSVFPLT